MKEGYIIYVVGEEPPRESELAELIRDNHLDLFEYRICGAAPLPGVYRACRELQKKRVSQISCLSVIFNREDGSYSFLDQSFDFNAAVDLSRFCSPEELGN